MSKPTMYRCEAWRKCKLEIYQCAHKGKHTNHGDLCASKCKRVAGIFGSICRPITRKPAVNWEKRARELHRAIETHCNGPWNRTDTWDTLKKLAAQRPDGRAK